MRVADNQISDGVLMMCEVALVHEGRRVVRESGGSRGVLLLLLWMLVDLEEDPCTLNLPVFVGHTLTHETMGERGLVAAARCLARLRAGLLLKVERR